MDIMEGEIGICNNCNESRGLNDICIDFNITSLCDECLQELNRKIVENLAEKHL